MSHLLNHRIIFISVFSCVKMEHLLEENVATEDLKKFETRYQTELNAGQVSSNAQFDYAWCLVRSKYPSDIRKGLLLLEDLCRVSLRNKVFPGHKCPAVKDIAKKDKANIILELLEYISFVLEKIGYSIHTLRYLIAL